MIKFETRGTSVVAKIDTGIASIEKRVLPMEWESGKEIYAELLRDRLMKPVGMTIRNDNLKLTGLRDGFNPRLD